MKNYWHCELCDNQTLDLMKGSVCNLTSRKPEFHRSCTKIALNEKHEIKLKEVVTLLRFIERVKWIKYGYFLTFFILGCGFLWFAFNVMSFPFSKYFKFYRMAGVSTAPIVMGGISFMFYHQAFGTLNKLHQNLRTAQRDKTKIDQVLSLYNINYKVSGKLVKDNYETQDVDLEIKQGRLYKQE